MLAAGVGLFVAWVGLRVLSGIVPPETMPYWMAFTMDGRPVLETEADDPLGNGAAGLQAYDTSQEESAERFLVAWHDFAVEPA